MKRLVRHTGGLMFLGLLSLVVLAVKERVDRSQPGTKHDRVVTTGVGILGSQAAEEQWFTLDLSKRAQPIPALTGVCNVGPQFVAPLRQIGVQMIGFDQVFDLVVPISRASNGTIQGLWSALDAPLDLIRQAGAHPIIGLDFTPTALSSRPHLENSARRSVPPTSYAEWEQLVYETVRYVNVERKAGVMYWGVWNEPDQGMFWDVDHQRYTRWATTGRDADLWTPSRLRPAAPGQFRELARLLEYLKLYEASVRGARRADPTVRIGGPATSMFDRRWMAVFLNACAERDIRVDFVSWHYPSDPDELRESVRWLREWAAHHRLPPPAVVITEWNMERAAGGDPWEEAVQTLDMSAAFVEVGVQAALYYNIGRLFDAALAPVPLGRAFQGLGLLRGWSIPCTTSGNVRVLAAQDTTGRVAAVLWARSPGHRVVHLRLRTGSTHVPFSSYTIMCDDEQTGRTVVNKRIEDTMEPTVKVSMEGRAISTVVFMSERVRSN